MTKLHQGHDRTSKHLFSYPDMARDLLKAMVPETWIGNLDFSTLQPLNVEHVTSHLELRRSDLIWKIRVQDEWLYLIFLLEFQST